MENNFPLIKGRVEEGKKRGKRLGFPTANIPLQNRLKEGVYLSQTTIDGKTHPSLTFIGRAITFHETTYQSETYLLNQTLNLYNKELEVKLLSFLRENKKFESEIELIKQMEKDREEAQKFFAKK